MADVEDHAARASLGERRVQVARPVELPAKPEYMGV